MPSRVGQSCPQLGPIGPAHLRGTPTARNAGGGDALRTVRDHAAVRLCRRRAARRQDRAWLQGA
eukprot:6893453-Pyramimonas_sp.AAC.1